MNTPLFRRRFGLTRLRNFITRLFTTFRGRLALLYISVELSVLLFAGILLYVVLSRQIYASVDNNLKQQGDAVIQEMESSRFYFWSQQLANFSGHFIGSVQLVGANGVLLFASDKALIGRGGGEVTEILRLAMEGHTAFASTRSLLRKDNMRVLAMPVYRGGRIVAALILGRSTGEIHSFFELMYLAGGMLGLLSMLISAYAGFVMSRRALKPLDEIIAAARRAASGDLSQRLKSFSQDREIGVLIRALNKMFGDLESSFKAQKRFTADASHELRLPLTVMKGEIEVTLRRERNIEEYEQVLQQQLGTIERMQRIVDGLLTLARADAGLLELMHQEVDLSLLLQEAGQEHLGLFHSKD
ncbi:MAG TPA: histidine kinase dimerization/phospho-acceptor domain-containing protein, partial [Mariprofundaceae bacterium]|nr:histidine kinase dimerization/phospho-acceptor domain-containing protein [Mariprofundaceae bacterium]